MMHIEIMIEGAEQVPPGSNGVKVIPKFYEEMQRQARRTDTWTYNGINKMMRFSGQFLKLCLKDSQKGKGT